MNSETRTLFIGGYVDGERLLVPEHLGMYHVPIRKQFQLSETSSPLPDLANDICVYKKHLIRGQNRCFRVFAEASIHVDDVLMLLLSGYHA